MVQLNDHDGKPYSPGFSCSYHERVAGLDAEVTRLTKKEESIKTKWAAIKHATITPYGILPADLGDIDEMTALLYEQPVYKKPAVTPPIKPLAPPTEKLGEFSGVDKVRAMLGLERLVKDEPARQKAIIAKFDEDHGKARPAPCQVCGKRGQVLSSPHNVGNISPGWYCFDHLIEKLKECPTHIDGKENE